MWEKRCVNLGVSRWKYQLGHQLVFTKSFHYVMKYYDVITVGESESFVEYHMKMIRLGEFMVLHCGRKDVFVG